MPASWSWFGGPRGLSRWIVKKPIRFLCWLCCVMAMSLLFLAEGVADDSLRMLAIGAFAILSTAIQALIYGPRAWRAMRTQPPKR